MRLSPIALAGALLLQPALAAADDPPLAPTAMPAPPPPAGYTPQLRYKTHSPALMGGGIALTILGAGSLLGGATAIVVDQNSRGDWRGIITAIVGLPLIIHGVGCVAGGIPMIVIGNRQIPAGYARPPAMPSLAVGPTTTLRWTF